ncbi:MAG: hypothetical protein ACYSU0_22605 [Planctomycetota bacterium]
MRRVIAGAAAAVVLLLAVAVAASTSSARAKRRLMETRKRWIADDLAALAEAKRALETRHPDWERLDEHETKGLSALKARVRQCIFAYDQQLSFFETRHKVAVPKEPWVVELEEALGRAGPPGARRSPAPAAEVF